MVPPPAMMDSFNSSLLMDCFIPKYRSRSPSNTCMSVIPGAGISIEVAEAEDSSMKVVPAEEFSTELEAEEVESEVKLGRVALSGDGSPSKLLGGPSLW